MCNVSSTEPLIETDKKPTQYRSRKWHVVWHNVIFFTLMHLGSFYGIYLALTRAKWQTLVYAYVLYIMSTVGVTAGAHRLWSHRAYKVKLPLKIILLYFYTLAYQGSVYQWVRDHRVHHKYCDTDADPHNSTRGFFFSHIGWLLIKKHPDVTSKGRHIELSDIKADKILNLHKKYYYFLVFLLSYLAPTVTPVLWNEEKYIAFYIAAVLRLTLSLHAVFLINSAAHMYGTKPYDKQIRPVETITVSLVAAGEGFHNYHHTFPWDYKAAELGGYALNISRLFIDIMAKIGWAYDLRTVSPEMIAKRVQRTGDGSHPTWQFDDSVYETEQPERCLY